MPKIIPYIGKSNIGRECQYPIKYSDLEACLVGKSTDDLYLDVHFLSGAMRDMERRKQSEEEGRFELILLNANVGPFLSDSWGKPWIEVENPLVIRASIQAVPREILLTCKLERLKLRSVLCEQVKSLTPNGITSRRWRLRVSLLTKEPAVECKSIIWNGIKEEPERRVVFPIKEMAKS